MATWGKLTIPMHNYYQPPTLYYDYNTTSDMYVFIEKGIDEYTGAEYTSQDYFGNCKGEAMMEAFIHHIMCFDSYNEERFVERFIRNNRFKKEDLKDE